ncbi:hypothetical protein ACFLQW_01090 [Candidatus Zixiibacteriota bacterium]
MKHFITPKQSFGGIVLMLLLMAVIFPQEAFPALKAEPGNNAPQREVVFKHRFPTQMTIDEAIQYESRIGERDEFAEQAEKDLSFTPQTAKITPGEIKSYPIPPNAIYCGETTWDFQWYGGPQRSVEHGVDSFGGSPTGKRFVHVVWTCLKNYDVDSYDRNVHYNCYDWTIPGWRVSTDAWGGMPIVEAGERGGYAHVDVNSDGNAVVFHHCGMEDAETYARVVRFSIPSFGIYTADRLPGGEGSIRVHGAIGTEEIAPQATSDVYHVGAQDFDPSSGDPAYTAYWRYIWNGTSHEWQGPVPMGQSMVLGHVLAADGERVIFAWPQARYYGVGPNQYDNDLGYWESIEAGADWIAEGGRDLADWDAGMGWNVTDYVDNDPHRVFVDISVMFDLESRLHALFTTPVYSDEASMISVGPTLLQHWYEGETPNANAQVSGGMPIGFVGGTDAYHSIAASAMWGLVDHDLANDGSPGAWNRYISKMTLGIGDGSTACTDPANDNTNEGYLYAQYTLFGGIDPADKEDASASGMQNGNQYISMSNDNGFTWDAGRCLTTAGGSFMLGATPTQTPGCDCPTGNPADPECAHPCMSEHWGSMARVVNDTLHAFYVVDVDAGGIPFDEGNWAVNKVVYHPLIGDGAIDGNLCPMIAPVIVPPIITGDPDCEYHGDLAPGLEPINYETLSICNYGNDDLNYSVNINQLSGGPNDWMLIDGGTSIPPTTIPPGGGCDQYEVEMDAEETPAKGMYQAEIAIDHNDPNPGLPDPYVITVSFFVADSFVCGEGVVMTTPCVALEVSNTESWGRERQGMSYYNATDEDSLYNPIYDASLVIVNKTLSQAGPDVVAYRDIFSNQTPGNPGFRALEEPKIAYHAATNESLVTANQVTVDSTVGISVKYIFPQDADSCEYVRMLFRLYPNTFSDPDLIVGAAADLDVGTTTEGIFTNGDMGGWVPEYNLVYCHGTEPDTLISWPDTIEATTQYAAGMTALTCQQDLRAVVQSNRNYVYPEGGYTDEYLFAEFDSTGVTIWIDQEDDRDGMDYVDDIHVLLAYPEVTLAEDAWAADGGHVFQLAMVTSTQATEDVNAADYDSPYEGYVTDLIDQTKKAWKKGFGWPGDFAVNAPPLDPDAYPYTINPGGSLYLNATGTHQDGIGACCGCDFSNGVVVDPTPTAGSITLVDDGNCRAHLAISSDIEPVDAVYTVTVAVADLCGDQTDELTFDIYVDDGCDCLMWGDINLDGGVDPLDVVIAVQCGYIWNCRPLYPRPNCPWDILDVNCNYSGDPVDIQQWVHYVFLSNPWTLYNCTDEDGDPVTNDDIGCQ